MAIERERELSRYETHGAEIFYCIVKRDPNLATKEECPSGMPITGSRSMAECSP